MRLWIVRGVLLVSVLMLVVGCTHFELPKLPDSITGHKSRGDRSRVDVSGVNDDVKSEKIVIKRIPFPADEYAELQATGDSTVKGKIFINYNGDRIAGHHTRLYLNPVTSYSNQWYRESYLAGHKMGKSDPRLFNYLKFTASDNEGNFAFYGVPAGSYYVVGTVKCRDCGDKNVRIARKISVTSSNDVTVELAKSL